MEPEPPADPAAGTVTDDLRPPYDPPPIGPRRLTRSGSDRMVAGVCGGIATYLGVDATIVRIGFALLSLTGIGLIAYAFAWALLPEEGDTNPRWRPAWQLAGVAIGVLLLADLVDWWHVDSVTVPLTLLVIGAVLVWGAHDNDGPGDGRGDRSPSPRFTTPEPADSTVIAQTGPGRWSWSPPPPPAHPAPPPAPPKRDRSGLGRAFAVGIGGVLIAIGAMSLAVAVSDGIAPTVVLGLTLAAFGVAMVAGSWWGWTRPLSVGGMLLVLAIALVAVVDVPIAGGIGERQLHPTTVDDLAGVERLALGQLEVDLTDLNLVGDERHFEASVAVGELEIEVPDGVTVELHGEVGAGVIDVFGVEHDGWSPEVDEVFEGSGEGRIQLDLRVGIGHVEVRRGR